MGTREEFECETESFRPPPAARMSNATDSRAKRSSKGLHIGPDVLVIVSSLFSVLVLLGLWTAVAGVLSAAVEAALLLTQSDEPRVLFA